MDNGEYILRSKREDVKADSRLFSFLEEMDALVLARGPRSLLVRIPSDTEEKWPKAIEKDWIILAEHKYEVPDTRKLIGKKPAKSAVVKKSKTAVKKSTPAKKRVSKK